MNSIKNGQISVEYIVLIGFLTFAIIAILGISLFYSSMSKEQMKYSQLERAAKKITSTAEAVYYKGTPSKARISVYIPEGVEAIEIRDRQIIFNLSSSHGKNRISYTSNVPIEGGFDVTSGVKIINIEAQTDKVMLSPP